MLLSKIKDFIKSCFFPAVNINLCSKKEENNKKDILNSGEDILQNTMGKLRAFLSNNKTMERAWFATESEFEPWTGVRITEDDCKFLSDDLKKELVGELVFSELYSIYTWWNAERVNLESDILQLSDFEWAYLKELVISEKDSEWCSAHVVERVVPAKVEDLPNISEDMLMTIKTYFKDIKDALNVRKFDKKLAELQQELKDETQKNLLIVNALRKYMDF